MRRLFQKLLKDQHGMIVSSEVVLVGTILVLGCIVGLAAMSHAVNNELNDVANAYMANQNSGWGPNGTQQPRQQYTITDSQGVPEVAGNSGY